MESKVELLQSISVRGFKSFKNKAKIGPLTNFSCIIGPNGAGKSVIGEALAFALGGFARTMRAKSAAALINDHLKKQRNPSAKVSVTMRLTDGKTLKVSRLLSGTRSQYFIKENGTKREITLNALKDELTAIGIDVNATDRFLVMQNQQVVKARQPLELSKYFEWLTGAGNFEELIAEVEQRISKFTCETATLQDSLIAVQCRRSTLSPVVEAWQRFYKEWQNFIQRKMAFLRRQEKTLKSQLETYLLDEQKLAAELEATERTISETGDALKQLISRKNELHCAISEISKVAGRAAKRKEELRAQVIKAKVRLQEARKECERQKKSKQTEAADLVKQKHDIEEELKVASTELAELETRLVEEEDSSSRQQLLKAETERDSILLKITRVEELLKEAELQKEKSERKVLELTAEIQSLQDEITKTTSIAEHHEEKRAAMRKRTELVIQQMQSTSQGLARLKVELAAAEKRVMKMDSNGRKSREDEAASLFKNRLQGRLVGRLADIATVQDDIVTAANAVLCHLLNLATTYVTGDRAAANEIIGYFRDHRIGVATCEILAEAPRGAAYSADRRSLLGYILCHENVKCIFGKYLNDWIVLPDRAAAISYFMHRIPGLCNVVTLAGDIFKKDGEVVRAPVYKQRQNMLRGTSDLNVADMEIDGPSIDELVAKRSALKAAIAEEERKLSGFREELEALQERFPAENTHATSAKCNVLQSKLQNKVAELNSVRLRLRKLAVDDRLSNELRELLLRKEEHERCLSDLRALLPADAAGCSVQTNVKRKKSRIKQMRKQLQDVNFLMTYKALDDKVDLVSLENALDAGISQLEEVSLEYNRRSGELEAKKLESTTMEEAIHAQNGLAAKAKKKRGLFSSKLQHLSGAKIHLQSSLERVVSALSETAEDPAFKRICLDQTSSDESSIDGEGQNLAQEEKLLMEERRTIDTRALEEDVACRKKELSLNDELNLLSQKLKSEGLLKEELETRRFSAFREAMIKVNECLSKIYRGLTKHGDAYLTYTEDKSLLFVDGVHFHVRPDRHRWRSFRSLSGGQQALAGLALSFSLQLAYPSPFYFFDEIDASFDTKNARIVAEYLQGMASAQYILVSHRPQLYELASTLVGIYHLNEGSACVTVSPEGNHRQQPNDLLQFTQDQITSGL